MKLSALVVLFFTQLVHPDFVRTIIDYNGIALDTPELKEYEVVILEVFQQIIYWSNACPCGNHQFHFLSGYYEDKEQNNRLWILDIIELTEDEAIAVQKDLLDALPQTSKVLNGFKLAGLTFNDENFPLIFRDPIIFFGLGQYIQFDVKLMSCSLSVAQSTIPAMQTSLYTQATKNVAIGKNQIQIEAKSIGLDKCLMNFLSTRLFSSQIREVRKQLLLVTLKIETNADTNFTRLLNSISRKIVMKEHPTIKTDVNIIEIVLQPGDAGYHDLKATQAGVFALITAIICLSCLCLLNSEWYAKRNAVLPEPPLSQVNSPISSPRVDQVQLKNKIYM